MGSEPDFPTIAIQLGAMFKPSGPVSRKDLFFGRQSQIRQVCDAINQEGMHAILYGEAGVGKTSLANVLREFITSARPIICPHVNCDSSHDYASLWRAVFSEIRFITQKPPMSFQGETTITATPLAEKVTAEITPLTVRSVLTELSQSALVYVILDELDKLDHGLPRKLMADTIKLFSDRSVPATLVLVGVADDVNGLIGDHRSIERCLKQIHLPRMGRDDIEQIPRNGYASVGMDIDADALNAISGLSKGLPHFAHLLSLHAGRAAIDSKRLIVQHADIGPAVDAAVEQVDESIMHAYQRAIHSTKKEAKYKQVLLACAMAETDEFGNFSPINVVDPFQKIMNKTGVTTDKFSKHLKAFCDNDRGPVLKMYGHEYNWTYRFVNPLLQPYSIMCGLREDLISESELKLNFDSTGQGRLKLRS
jgi:Cdc6-like AAA superfamily ATPase